MWTIPTRYIINFYYILYENQTNVNHSNYILVISPKSEYGGKELWDLGIKDHSQLNLVKINTILHKYVCMYVNVKNKYRYVLCRVHTKTTKVKQNRNSEFFDKIKTFS
jgi:hypothetical protein